MSLVKKPSLWSGMVAQATVFLASLEIANAQLGQIGRIALIDLLHWQVAIFYIVIAKLQIFRFVHSRGDYSAAFFYDPNPEFQCGGFVVRIEEAVLYARSIDQVFKSRSKLGGENTVLATLVP